jgi:hypothetical protein
LILYTVSSQPISICYLDVNWLIPKISACRSNKMIFLFKDHMVEYVSFERDSAYFNTCIYTELTLEITITYLCHIMSVLLFHIDLNYWHVIIPDAWSLVILSLFYEIPEGSSEMQNTRFDWVFFWNSTFLLFQCLFVWNLTCHWPYKVHNVLLIVSDIDFQFPNSNIESGILHLGRSFWNFVEKR